MNTCSPAINTAKNPAQFIPSYLIEKESKQAFLSIITIKSLIFPSNFLLTCKNSWTRLPWADNKGHNSFSITKTKTKSLQKRIFRIIKNFFPKRSEWSIWHFSSLYLLCLHLAQKSLKDVNHPWFYLVPSEPNY